MSPTFEADVWSFGLVCLEVFTDADPYRTTRNHYVPVLLSKGKPPEHPGTAAVGLSSKMWELMQSCWEVDPAARPDMLKIQIAMRDIPSRVERRPTVIARHPGTSPVRIEPSLPTHVSPTIGGGSAHETNGSLSESSFSPIPPPLMPPPPRGVRQLPLEPSPTIHSPLLPELEGTRAPKKGGTALPLRSLRLLPLDDSESHSPSISVFLSTHLEAPPQFSRPSSRPSALSASDFLGPISPTSSQQSEGAESAPPKRKLSRSYPKRSASGQCHPVTVTPNLRCRSESKSTPVPSPRAPSPQVTNPEIKLSRSPTVLPIISTIRQRVSASEDVLRSLKDAASDTEALFRLARDGSVSAGNLEGLLNRAIFGSLDPSRDERFKTAFLTIYQLFATSEQVFEILKRRFQATSADPYMGSSRYS